jgi:antirestriction protein ArdC
MSKLSVYEVVTNKIIEKLEKGVVPWHKPWNHYDSKGNLILHMSYTTKQPYKGINQFLLNCTDYKTPYWLTFKQIQQTEGLSLKKGSKSEMICFFKPVINQFIDTFENPADCPEDEKDLISIRGFVFKYYNVFNAECVEGLESVVVESIPEDEETEEESFSLDKCEEIIKNWINAPIIKHEEAKAYYSPVRDIINLPKKSAFEVPEEYYCTAFHEMTHATGSEKRLNRFSEYKSHSFGSHDYSKEELVAEMGASFLCGFTGIENSTIDNSTAYIQGWLSKLKSDKKLVVVAASQAEKAVNYILNNQKPITKEETPKNEQLTLF